ncbi:hypothetical protein [Absidia glauca]|uniref:Uncharacterized protein n=1 Tax=Absidia glauca TaxID=4829 RepID=A0A163JUI9_ABSGL|nr:hypothetical protein [Absidia glauca]
MSRKVLGISANELITIFSKPSGLQSHHNCFSVKAIPWKSSPVGLDPHKDLRVMFVAGKKKLGKLAVYRNRAQRRVKASVSDHFLDMAPKGHDYMFYLSPPAVLANWQDLQDQMQLAASKIKSLLRKETPYPKGKPSPKLPKRT